ncbi:MAG: MarR family transcriptional regulator [Sedimenticola sp.]|uniref:MarR family transcriptional regulator n=1 Tax=Sedimenticola thiotaurini TaxID=1543721 RepID=A0A558DAT3_9GAMM|nr:MarR family transcriptional regulator [Sedimenticola sp.]MCW8949081.1 MarR family transcriptional regulator [Sedimenticola sp.]MCW8974260.1 MarR family transcriptional regulator [Sedimenticola sp.]TVT58137.1 MAG: MarR family transcriptional regulator [Sedimenticola thiotaurini]
MSSESISSVFVIKNALLASKLSKRVGNHLSAHGISLAEYLVMHYLDNSPQKAVPRIELAEHIGMSASGITRLISPMEKNKIVEKVVNPRDARQSLVKLSKTGQRLYGEASTSFEYITNELVGNLSLSQQEKIVALYAKVI